jgi:hypothetical protein
MTPSATSCDGKLQEEDDVLEEVERFHYHDDDPEMFERERDDPPGGVVESVWTYSYDEHGRKVKVIYNDYPDTNTGQSEYGYDDNGNRIFEDHSTSSLKLRYEYTYDCWE